MEEVGKSIAQVKKNISDEIIDFIGMSKAAGISRDDVDNQLAEIYLKALKVIRGIYSATSQHE